MKLAALALIAFFFTAFTVRAETLDPAAVRVIFGNLEMLGTSSQYQSLRASGEIDLRKSADVTGYAGVALTSGTTQGLAFNFQKLYVGADAVNGSWKFSPQLSFVNRGANAQDYAQALGGFLKVAKTIAANHEFSLELGDTVLAEDYQTAAAVQELLRGPYYRLNYAGRVASRWRLSANQRQATLIDHNVRAQHEAALLYGISPDWPWIWVGVGGERLTNSLPQSPYWSPREFFDYGPRVDVAAPLGRDYSIALGLNLNLFTDIDSGSGVGYYAIGKLIKGEAGKRKLELGVESIHSRQGASDWDSFAVRFGGTWPF